MITIKIAGIPIGIDNRFPFMQRLAANFLTDEAPLFTVFATDEDLREEQSLSESGVIFPPDYLESIVVYRKIAGELYKYDAMVFHGAVLDVDGVAYAFTANSGVGKTTHIRLWLSEFSDRARVLNGDKPILRIMDGRVYACGTPWQGKENYGFNAIRPLGAIAFLSRGALNLAKGALPSDVTVRLMNQIYLNKKDAISLIKTMRIADTVLNCVPLFELECNMDPEAAHVAYSAMVRNNGQQYSGGKK